MNITVIGCGRWGTFIAWYLDSIGHNVKLYGKSNAPQMQELLQTRKNNLISLSDSMTLTTSLDDALSDAQTIIVSIGSQALRGLLEEIKPYEIKNQTFVLCMKGIETGTGRRLSEIAEENLDPSCRVAVWIGPGHVQEFYKGHPNCMVIDSKDEDVKHRLVAEFSSDLIRYYYGQDLLGNEIGAASKNVIGIAAGMLDGLGLSTLKGALMSRGTREIARLIKAMGGNELSAYGLCHLGDYEATVFSEYSHNRMFGEMLVKGQKYDQLAEGYYTADAMMVLADRYGVEIPICRAVYNILYKNADIREELSRLFTRSLKSEIE